jgi:hypothetical protein
VPVSVVVSARKQHESTGLFGGKGREEKLYGVSLESSEVLGGE